jgi:glycerol kinase
MTQNVLAIDQGTTGTTCLVVRAEPAGLSIVGKATVEFPQHFPKPGWVEHELDEIWASTLQAMERALRAAGVDGQQIAAIGITNQRETTGLWDLGGRPVHRAIVWQDRRTADRCQTLAERGHSATIKARTGLVIDPYFSGTKLGWLLDNVAGLRARAARGELRFGTIDTWLVWKLTQGAVHVTDVSNASRTLLYDIHRQVWDAELCSLLGDIPASLLPEVRDSSGVYGKTRNIGIVPDGIPIAGMAGDQQAALFGQACFTAGAAKCTYGTGAFALVNTGGTAVPSEHGLLTTIAWRLKGETTYALEGSTFIAGAIVQWLRDGLGFFSSSQEIEALARSVADNGGVVLVPALTGLGAPHWRPQARGAIFGLTRGTTRAHIARAALEGIALQVGDLLGAMRADSKQPLTVLRVDGGASANSLLMQFQADILGVDIHRPQVLETTAFGAACLAGLGVGIFSDIAEVARAWKLERTFKPTMPSERVNEHVQRWREAIGKV